MKKSNLLNSLILAALAVPGVAMAESSPLTANVGLVSDYLVRGISQTSGTAALQGGVDYAHSSGIYLGLWGSNMSWITDFGATGTSSLELDTYGGFRGAFADDFSYDLGFIRYNYLGDYTPVAGTAKADTQEVYGSIGYKWISAKYSYSLGDFLTVPNAKGTSYLELNASYSLADSGVTLGAHYGKQTYKGPDADLAKSIGLDPSYTDYKLSVSKDFSGYVIGLAYSDTNVVKNGFYTTPLPAAKDLGRSTVVVSVVHAM